MIKNKYIRKVIMILGVIVLVILHFNVSAAEFLRLCRYTNPSTNETLWVAWEKKGNAFLYDTSMKEIGRVPGSSFEFGCQPFLGYSIDYGKVGADIKWGSDASVGNFQFSGIPPKNGKDVFFGNSYNEFKNDPTSNEFLEKPPITCSYNVLSGFTVNLTVTMNGEITVITKDSNGKKVVTTSLKNPQETFKVIHEDHKCPATICFDKLPVGATASFHGDVNHKCSTREDSMSTNDRTERQVIDADALEFYLPPETREEGDSLKDQFTRTSRSYAECLRTVDVDGKCSIGDVVEYINCIEENYNKDEIEVACGDKSGEYETAKNQLNDFANETGDPIANKIIRGESIPDFSVPFDPTPINCDALLGPELLEWIKNAYFLIEVGAIIIIIIMVILDYGGSIISGDDEAMKKANKNFTTRLIVLIILILLPILVEFILNIASIEGLVNTNPLCK